MSVRPMLSSPEFGELDAARLVGLKVPVTEGARWRYRHYRRRLGMSPHDARLAALAYEENLAEERIRRRSHGTGAT